MTGPYHAMEVLRYLIIAAWPQYMSRLLGTTSERGHSLRGAQWCS